MNPLVIALVVVPLTVPAGIGIAVGARNPGLRVVGLIYALAATAIIAYLVGENRGLQTAVDLCSDEAGAYFSTHERFAPFCIETR